MKHKTIGSGFARRRSVIALATLFFTLLGLLVAQRPQPSNTAHVKSMPRYSTSSGRIFFGDPAPGESWQLLAAGRLYINPYDNQTAIRIVENGVERSEDGGETFQLITTPFEDSGGTRFYFVSTNSEELFAQSAAGELAYSNDTGETWNPITLPAAFHPDGAAPFAVLSNGQTRLLLGSSNGLFIGAMPEDFDVSQDVQWREPEATGAVSAVATSPLNDAFAVGTVDGHVRINFETEDLDAISRIATRPREFAVVVLAFHPEDSEQVVPGFGVKSDPSDRVLFYSQDGGRSWQDGDGQGYTALPDSPVRTALFVQVEERMLIYVVTQAGLFSSHDFIHWTLEAGLPDPLDAEGLALLGAHLVATSAKSALAATVRNATVKCTFTVTPTKKDVGAKGGDVEFKVNANSSTCAWSVTKPSSSAPWSISRGQTGRGDGEATLAVKENTTTKSRSMNISIAGKTVSITQAAASVSCDPKLKDGQTLNRNLAPGGATISVNVVAGSGCKWLFSASGNFVSIKPASGTGDASVTFTVPVYSGTNTRVSDIKIGRQSFTLSQWGGYTDPPATSCSVSASPVSFLGDGGKGTLNIVKTASCGTITLKSSATWLTLATTQVSANSSMAISFNVASGTTRTADITATATGSITGGSIRITQTAPPPAQCTAVSGTLSTASFLSNGGTAQLAIKGTGNCSNFSVTSDQSWATVSVSGSTATVSVVANSGAARSAKLTIRSGTVSSQPIAISQAAPPINTGCTFTIGQTVLSFSPSAGSTTVSVTTAAGCKWSVGAITTSATPSTWVSASPLSSTGSGTVTVKVSAADIQDRKATVVIANATVTINQRGLGTTSCECTGPACGANMQMGIGTTNFTINGGSTVLQVGAPTTCRWTLEAPPSWISYATSGTGNASINVQVAKNTTGMSRSFTIKSPQAKAGNDGRVAQATITQAGR